MKSLYSICFEITDNTSYGSNIASRDAPESLHKVTRAIKEMIECLDRINYYEVRKILNNVYLVCTTANTCQELGEMIEKTFNEVNTEVEPGKFKYSLEYNVTSIQEIATNNVDTLKWKKVVQESD